MATHKLRIAFFGDDFSRKGRGTALVIQRLAEELDRPERGVEITLLRPKGSCESALCDRVRSGIIPRRFSTALSYLWFFVTHREHYDVIVFNRVVYPGFFFLSARMRVLFAHDASVSEIYTAPRTWVNHVFDYFLKFVGKFFLDAVFASSDDARTWIARYFAVPLHKVHTLYLAAGDGYKPLDDAARRTKAEHLSRSYNIRSPYILAVSRFDPHKNIEGILDAFFILKKEHVIPHSLVLLGGPHTPGYSQRMMKKIEMSSFRSDVHIVTYVETSDMPALYSCASLLLYPSLVEGFGLPLLEAFASGTPVVTSNISSLPEVAEGAAQLVDPQDPRKIAEGIRAVLKDDNLRARLVEKGSVRVRDFSWTKTADMFMKVVSGA